MSSGKFETVQNVIDDYEQQMLAYAKEAQAESTENEIEMRNPNFKFQQLLNVQLDK